MRLTNSNTYSTPGQIPNYTPFDAHCYHGYIYLGSLILSLGRQSARMSKITNDGLTRSGTGCTVPG